MTQCNPRVGNGGQRLGGWREDEPQHEGSSKFKGLRSPPPGVHRRLETPGRQTQGPGFDAWNILSGPLNPS